MGYSLPMFLSSRTFLRRLAVVLGLAFAAYAAQAWAQTAVETYTDQATPPAEPGLALPEGVEWNKPLKAGDMTLSHPAPKKTPAKKAEPARKSLPVGQLKAPQIQKPTEPPSLAPQGQSSSANVMLMQGMRSALQKSGKNPDVPEQAEVETGPAPASLSPIPLAPPLLKGAKAAAAPATPALMPAATDSDIKYEPGRAPKDLATMAMPQAEQAAEAAADMPSTDKSLAPSIDAGLVDTQMPKATEIKEPQKETKSRGILSSIFGPAVESGEDEEKQAAAAPSAPAPKAAASGKACESKVTAWTKTCVEVGYPKFYVGKVAGETRIECPSGESKDIWISNTCASSPSASSDDMPLATDLSEPPPSLTGDVPLPAPDNDAHFVSSKSKRAPGKAPASDPAPTVVDDAAPVEPVKSPAEDERVDANCGTANGLAVASKPAADLCLSGSAGDVAGEGPWRWTCLGQNGGVTVSCAAPVAKASAKKTDISETSSVKPGVVEDGQCGPADGMGADSAPIDGLCAKGIASRVNGGGPWTWACSGKNGGQAAGCTAPKKVDGTCGASAENGAASMPDRDLCITGYASAVTGEGPWNWTCSGLYGGAAVTCSAAPKVNAVCGAASLTGHRNAPSGDLCTSGAPSIVEGDGPWTWSCAGELGGATVSCKAPTLVDGLCGAANGGSFEKEPDEDLCAQGRATRVTGLGPWTWNCAGQDGGNTASCTASLGRKAAAKTDAPVACGPAAEMAAFSAPSQGLCANGKPSAVAGDGPWSWSCSDDDSHNVSCSTLKAVEGACGESANVPSVLAPSENLCASGVAGAVSSDKAKKTWSWDCRGASGGSAVSCSAPVLSVSASRDDAKCGEAAGRGATRAPKSDLCASGKASAVRGSGPWMWTCVAKSGNKTSCEAPKTTDGVCGSSNGSIQKALPLSGLCASGVPTEVSGNGPWLWSCIGAGGGASVSCSAASQSQTKIDGSCGAAGNSVSTHAPDVNLCDSGAPSAVNGDGPWTWTCSGMNGGIASTCTTSKVVPKAPLPPGPAVNGNCGPANGVAAVNQPLEGLCSSGTVTSVSGNGPWNWNCLGINGGMTVSCTAPLMPPAPIEGVCGAANGVTTLTKPRSGLCSAGIASAVSGVGPWTWSCSGTNGGAAVSCVAPVAGSAERGASKPLPSTVTPVYKPAPVRSDEIEDEAPAPEAAPVGLVTPRLPSGPLPPLESGSLPQMQPSKPLNLPPEASMMPVPMRDDVKPAASLKPPQIDAEGKPMPGARLVLNNDLSTLSFDRGADALDKSSMATLDKLAGLLQTNGAARVTLTAYAATTGEITPRQARRLSLARALAARDYLTNKGIASSRIDVRALGANVQSGDMDRIDITAN